MKPAYEDILASEIKVSDIVRQSVKEWPIEVEFIDIGRSCVIVNGSRTYQRSEKVSRQLPPERNPEVLERALRSVIAFCGFMHHDIEDIACQWTQKAIQDMESEAGDGTTQTQD